MIIWKMKGKFFKWWNEWLCFLENGEYFWYYGDGGWWKEWVFIVDGGIDGRRGSFL